MRAECSCPDPTPVCALRVLSSGILLLLAGVLNQPAAAEIAPTALADSLFENGRYYEAATEYERVLFQNPDTALIRQARMKLVRAYVRGGELDKAEAVLLESPSSGDSAEWDVRSDLALGYLRQREYADARSELLSLMTITRDSAQRRTLSRELGWLSIETGDFGEAADEFVVAGDSGLAMDCRGLTRLPARSPGLAMLASTVIPGSGELYDGNLSLGLSSLVVNAAVIAGTVYCIDRKLYLDAALLATVLFGRFYFGSRSNAYDLARDFNERIRQQAARDLKRRYGKGAENR